MISVIIPFYNEEKNLPILLDSLINVTKQLKKEWEIILVDDGSDDKSVINIKNHLGKKHVKQQQFIKLISHRKRLGKGEALNTGVKNARGEVIVFMDADLQDDPHDLPQFLNKIEAGYDFVNGVRSQRQEGFLVKLYSRLAQLFLCKFLNSPYRDINCGFKAFRREVLQEFIFYGNNFRFFPLAVYYHGFSVTEVSVRNHPRRFGRSKFGRGKIFIGLLDMLTAYFLYKFAERPLHFFGIIGGALFLAGFFLTLYLVIERIFFNVLLYRRPILLLGILLIIAGIQIVTTGVIGELLVYLNKKNKGSDTKQPRGLSHR